MPLEPIIVVGNRQSYLSIDKYGRLRLNSAAKAELKVSAYQYVVTSVDVDLKRIGIAKQELAKAANATAAKVDKRGYVSGVGKHIARKLALNLADAPFMFEDVGFVDYNGVRWRAFDLVDER